MLVNLARLYVQLYMPSALLDSPDLRRFTNNLALDNLIRSYGERLAKLGEDKIRLLRTHKLNSMNASRMRLQEARSRRVNAHCPAARERERRLLQAFTPIFPPPLANTALMDIMLKRARDGFNAGPLDKFPPIAIRILDLARANGHQDALESEDFIKEMADIVKELCTYSENGGVAESANSTKRDGSGGEFFDSSKTRLAGRHL
ncbi:hypothetical protein [Robbsia andropogonis]|uniref:hypothetical protein n=1 Tax=Robbsia andropogonis TaxID=28092 RepID=UPI0020A05A8D|nr:hypothetical protein [Robbsia andropogonis]MCP1119046.1 hypothetical protein [Robbsia andropogonis]MCP1128602.1 hypothetical protein [Robbsia andropogonis]